MHTELKSFFEDIAIQCADQTAIRYVHGDYTYQHLNTLANKLAYYLQKNNICTGDVIAIASTKSFEDYALMIACLKIGIIYTNLDIDNPHHRTKNILDTCVPKGIFGNGVINSITKVAQESAINYTDLQKLDIKDYPETNPDAQISPDNIAYIMFTSGSTGVPKGVAIKHESVTNFIRWSIDRYKITEKDNFANISPMYFDNSVFDFYSALFSGATLTPITKPLLSDPLKLIETLDNCQCTIWFSVPSMLIYLLAMRVLTKDCFKHIRIITFGGEGFPKSELKKLYELYHNRAEIINVYGPTEGTCICSSYSIGESEFDNLSELPSLGHINEDFSYVIMDDDTPSTFGELWITGQNIAVGYYNAPDLTKKAFGTYKGDTMYKTGDLVEEINGMLYFKGRADNQIKHMGYRIELEEIEFALNSLSEITQSAVIYKRTNSAYGKIVAYLVTNTQTVDLEKIKKELSDILPEYMLPNIFKTLASFPKNQNGKIDKTQLKEMEL